MFLRKLVEILRKMQAWAEWFYLSKAWKKTRKAYKKSQNGLCERCKGAGRIVHHKIYLTPKNINNPLYTLDWSNLELLCYDCHNKEHHKRVEDRYFVDELGNVLPPKQIAK